MWKYLCIFILAFCLAGCGQKEASEADAGAFAEKYQEQGEERQNTIRKAQSPKALEARETAGRSKEENDTGEQENSGKGDRTGRREDSGEENGSGERKDSDKGNGSGEREDADKGNGTGQRKDQDEESGSGEREDSGGTASGALSVKGTQLVDSAGNPVQLRGISTHGLAWFPDYVNGDCIRQLKEEWGMNVFRLAMYTAESRGYCTGGNRDDLKALVRDGVEYATDCGMYVIIDWHILSDGNPNIYIDEAKAFFEEMSREYADYTNVFYEICNEPNGGTSWSDVKAYAEQVIAVIRENDEDGIILVGTPNWSQYVEQAAADPITDYSNIMYTLHFYAATHTDSLRASMVSAIESGLPVFVSEYGICDASGNGAIDVNQAQQWVQLMDEYQISYVAWNLSNKSETSAVIKSSCSKTGGFTEEDLSESGKWLYQMLQTAGRAGELTGSGPAEGSSSGEAGNDGSSGTTDNGGSSAGSGTADNGGSSGSGTTDGGGSGAAGNGDNSGTTDNGGSSAGSGATGNGGSSGSGATDGGGGQTGSWDGSQNGTAGNEESGQQKAPGALQEDELQIGIEKVNSWGQGDESYYQYRLTLTNSADGDRKGWTIRLTFSGGIELNGSWNGQYQAEDNILTISSMDYNAFISKGGSVGDIGFIVKGGENLVIEGQ